jgi:ABC-2 type transport system ATP-binding protein
MNAPPAQPVVACQRLVKVFKDFWLRARARAVDGISFEIRRGEVFGLLGPNGSGKSTTIKIILGLLRKTSGMVAVFGKPPSDVSIKRRIGYLPEESYLYPFLNARETLEYYGKLFGLDRAVRTRRIDELLDMVGLGAVQFRPVREYSKGMQRRIGIAQALINDPELLILDEPTTGLDPLGTRQIKDLIIQLGRRGKTVLLSSHLLADVEDCVDRMVILYGGRIRAEGTCDSLLTSQDRSVLEFDALDESTIAEVDHFVRRRTHGAAALTRVSRPRQRLEDLFVDIVEKARAERAETSGAQHGGATAAFLRATPDQAPSGDELIASLVQAGTTVAPPPPAPPAPPTSPAAAATPAAPAPEADELVLASLLGGGEGDDAYYTIDQAASRLGVAAEQVRGMVAAGDLQAVVDRGRTLLRAAEVDRLADRRAAGAAPAATGSAGAAPPDVDLGLIGSLVDQPSRPTAPPEGGRAGPERRP